MPRLESCLGLDVSRETIEKLEAFQNLLLKWTKSINLIAPNTIPDVWNRHIIDSAQILFLAPEGWSTWIDVGSGGGLPGIVIAILDRSDRQITLVESDKRKCLFLQTVRRELDLNISVVNDRITPSKMLKSDVVSARALAPLASLLGFANDLLNPDGRALFPKGEKFQEELDHAALTWQFDVIAHPSQTNSDSRVLEISRIRQREC